MTYHGERGDYARPRNISPRVPFSPLTEIREGYGGDVDLVGSDWAPEQPRKVGIVEREDYGGDIDLVGAD